MNYEQRNKKGGILNYKHLIKGAEEATVAAWVSPLHAAETSWDDPGNITAWVSPLHAAEASWDDPGITAWVSPFLAA